MVIASSLKDIMILRQEINSLFAFFSNLGEIVDLNLDYYPELIAVTFTKHADVQATLKKEKLIYMNAAQ